MYAMPGPRFFAFARRIAAYGGILARRIELQREREKPAVALPPAGASTQRPAHTSRAAAGRLPAGAHVVPVSALGMQMSGLFEMRKAPPGTSTTP